LSLCNAGRNQPIHVTVKSVDSEAMMMIVDMSFISHNHKAPTTEAETCEGDVLVELTDVLVQLRTNSLYYAYDPYNFDLSLGTPPHRVMFEIEESGVWKVQLYSYAMGLTRGEETFESML
jgi:hypothetical protein